ncbi:hypothetical protein B484DRAFT_254238 [Ochromonadaceae sp. CCMP2298]|nr:hypothetical protein B484DRAFT_254238 [Ochromonadaceae sp. CCMP2298]
MCTIIQHKYLITFCSCWATSCVTSSKSFVTPSNLSFSAMISFILARELLNSKPLLVRRLSPISSGAFSAFRPVARISELFAPLFDLICGPTLAVWSFFIPECVPLVPLGTSPTTNRHHSHIIILELKTCSPVLNVLDGIPRGSSRRFGRNAVKRVNTCSLQPNPRKTVIRMRRQSASIPPRYRQRSQFERVLFSCYKPKMQA